MLCYVKHDNNYCMFFKKIHALYIENNFMNECIEEEYISMMK